MAERVTCEGAKRPSGKFLHWQQLANATSDAITPDLVRGGSLEQRKQIVKEHNSEQAFNTDAFAFLEKLSF